MKIDEETITLVPEKEQGLLKSLLNDLKEINELTGETLYIDWQHYHNEWSPERTDPCPDYYGYYTIRPKKDYSETIGVEMDIYELDRTLYMLYEFVNLIYE